MLAEFILCFPYEHKSHVTYYVSRENVATKKHWQHFAIPTFFHSHSETRAILALLKSVGLNFKV